VKLRNSSTILFFKSFLKRQRRIVSISGCLQRQINLKREKRLINSSIFYGSSEMIYRLLWTRRIMLFSSYRRLRK